MPNKTKNYVTILIDQHSNEALYINDELVMHAFTIYACDIANAVGDMTFQFSVLNAETPEDHEWPENIEEVMQYVD